LVLEYIGIEDNYDSQVELLVKNKFYQLQFKQQDNFDEYHYFQFLIVVIHFMNLLLKPRNQSQKLYSLDIEFDILIDDLKDLEQELDTHHVRIKESYFFK
jgi:vacuolar-type H+-ATPase catalytic subunit A/Vma1